MTELQQKEFELLEIFVGICESHCLCYYLVCGSALGAVKYQGFIPWDDDIDVAMPREDYERFLVTAPSVLPEWVFLQNYRTDPAYPHVASKLRNSLTAFIETGMAHLPMNHGIYIDVFPLDGYPEGKLEGLFFELKKKILTWKQYCVLEGTPGLKVGIRNRIFRAFGYHRRTADTLAKLEKLITKYPAKNAKIWCNHANWQGRLEYADRRQYGQGARSLFEGLTVNIPEDIDGYLTQKYGDWRTDLPTEQQKSHHSHTICDVKKSYEEYM